MSRTLFLSWLLGAALATAVVSQQPVGSATYEIHGTVVDHLTNHIITRALVRLSPTTGQGQLTSLTGEDGRFAFSNIPKGKYQISAQRRGQAPHGLYETGQYSTAIVVGPGLDTSNVVFPLPSPAAIAGIVVDEDGDPFQSANIIVDREMAIEGEKRTIPIGTYQTNSLGQFRIAQLAAGIFYIAVQGVPSWRFSTGVNPAAADYVYPLTYYGNTTDAGAALPITLTEGETSKIEVTLRPVPNIHVPVPDTSAGASVPMSGRPSIPQFFQRGPGGTLVPSGVITTSDAEGRLELSGVPAGRYVARFYSRDLQANGSVQEVELANGVPLSLPEHVKRVVLSGHVSFEGAQRPAANIPLLFAERQEQNQFAVTIDSDGAFTLADRGVFPGWYSVQLNSSDYYIRTISAKGARINGNQVELTDDSPATLSITAALAGNLSKLDGFALRDGKPVAGAMVLLVPHDVKRTDLFRRDQSDSDGSFTLPGIVPGHYTLLALDDFGRGLLYKDPAVIQPYLAAGQTVTLPTRSSDPLKINVQPRLP